jgi:TolA-binding protein
MISLEQVRLLESKVSMAIDYVKKVTEENSQLKERLNSCQLRIDELEILVLRFKEDQNKIEDGILSALDRLNQFEDAIENTLSRVDSPVSKKPKPDKGQEQKNVQNDKKETESEKEAPDDEEAGELGIF